MKHKELRGGWKALLFCFMAVMMLLPVEMWGARKKSAATKAKADVESTFANPDFAFPQTVRKDALPEYHKAMKNGDAITALRAAMQLNVADRITSTDSVAVAMDRYVAIAKRFEAPYSTVAKLLEAQLLASVYSGNSWKFNQRELSDSVLNPEPMLWSGKQVRSKVGELCRQVIADSNVLSTTPVSVFATILTDIKQSEQFGLSMLDFATYKVIDIALMAGVPSGNTVNSDTLPFKESGVVKSKKSTSESNIIDPTVLIDQLIDADKGRCVASPDNLASGAGALCEARLRRLQYCDRVESYGGENAPFGRDVAELLNQYPAGNLLHTYVVCRLYETGWLNGDNLDVREAAYKLYEEAYTLAPDSKEASVLKYAMANLTQPSYTLQTEGMWVAGRPGAVNYSAQNVKDAYLLMVPVPTTFAQESGRLNKNITASGEIRTIAHLMNGNKRISKVAGNAEVKDVTPGYYALVMSSTPDLSGMFATVKNQNADIVNVTAISMFSADSGSEKSSVQKGDTRIEKNLYVVNSLTNAPVKGAEVKFKEYGKNGTSVILKTDGDGKVSFPGDKYYMITATYGGSQVQWSGTRKGGNRTDAVKKRADIMTDLALYHPGDTVSAAIVLSQCKDNLLSALENGRIVVKLLDVNRKEVAADTITSDRFGRGVVKLPIPTDGLTGSFSIRAEMEQGGRTDYLGGTVVEVAEYTSPTFKVVIDKVEVAEACTTNDEAFTLSGSVLTWSGMPVADATVNLTVSYRMPWRSYWRNSAAGGDYGVIVKTDATGRFSAKLTITKEDADKYRYGSFIVKGAATSPSGETQSGNSVSFALGKGYRLEASIPERIEIDGDSVSMNVRVVDNLSNPMVKRVDYTLSRFSYDSEQEIADSIKGSFESPLLKLKSSGLPSGMYKCRFILPEAFRNEKGEWESDSIEQCVTIWRRDDVRPPHATVLWTDRDEYYASEDSKSTEVRIGAGYEDEYLYYEIDNRNGVIRRGWLTPKGKIVTIKVDNPRAGEVYSVRVYGMYAGECKQANIRVLPAQQNLAGEFKVETFRDCITPGNKETWKFRFMVGERGNNNAMVAQGDAAVVAVLSNEALNSIVPFRWSMNPSSMLNRYAFGDISYPVSYRVYGFGNLAEMPRRSYEDISLAIPDFNLWGYSLANGYSMLGGVRIRGAKYKNMATTAGANGAVQEEVFYSVESDRMAMASAKVEAADAVINELSAELPADEGGKQETEQMRDVEMPLAFFKPLLTTDAEGNVEVEFTVPDYNTTWAFQMLGYNKDMVTGYLSEKCVASKPVMVQTFMPRFLRTGDKAQISATVYNNTAESADIRGRIEIFDIINGDVLAFSEETLRNLGASESRVITVEFAVPQNLNMVGVRSTGESTVGKDGEQGIVQILPSFTPVMDATTFYLNGDNRTTEVRLPKMNRTDCVTLNFCNNPQWAALTSLSGLLSSDSESTLDAVVSLYSNGVATGIINRYSSVKQGLEMMFAEDNCQSLLSPLMKNASLKGKQLDATPWVNNAESETLRMQGMKNLLNQDEARKVIASNVERLLKNTNSDGSWSWMKGMPGSEWITQQVLASLGDMKRIGYLPSDSRLQKALSAGVAYVDSEVAKDYSKIKNAGGEYPLTAEISWMYIRGNVSDGRPTGKQAEIMHDMLGRLAKEWKGLSLYDKATAAILLYRNGNAALAGTILESVRQMASYKESKGMWFDTASEGWFATNPMVLTARCLEAYKLVNPESDVIDKLCQYLILSRQAQDWNLHLGQAGVASVVSQLVASMPESYANAGNTGLRILLNGHEIGLDKNADALTGDVYVSLPADEASEGNLTIEREGDGVAWGGVMNQYVAPIAEVKEHSVPQISVEKMLLPVEVTSDGKSVKNASKTFRKGDRVRVTLTLKTDRALDYILLTDALGAWMQPVDQLSEYMVQDGVWMLREIRKDAVNFYLTRLPKGKYVISYEVNASRDGEYSTGIATAQSQYYPMITSHSAGALVNVK